MFCVRILLRITFCCMLGIFYLRHGHFPIPVPAEEQRAEAGRAEAGEDALNPLVQQNGPIGNNEEQAVVVYMP